MASNLYNGAAEYGRFQALLGLIVGALCCVSMCAGGLSIFNKKDTYDGRANGTVKTADCSMYRRKDSVCYSCINTVEYAVDGKLYSSTVTTDGNIMYNKNMPISIMYMTSDPRNTADASGPRGLTWRVIGLILMACGLCILLLSIGSYAVAQHFKFAAAGGAVASFFR